MLFDRSILTLALGLAPTALGHNGAPRAPAANVKPVSELPVQSIKELDMDKVNEEDEIARQKFEAPRFAVNEEVHITPATHGEWEENGTLWRFTFEAAWSSCVSLTFGFSEFLLDDDMDLFIYDADSPVVDGHGNVVGPTLLEHYTSKNNNHDTHVFWTTPVPSCHVVVELDLEDAVDPDEIVFTLSTVAQGYRDVLAAHGRDRRRELSGGCNRDVVCPEGDDWRAEIAAVGFMTFSVPGGQSSCTGTMLNNAAGNKRNLFLSARHCISTLFSANSLNVYWNFETSSCQRPNPDGSLSDRNPATGSTILALNEASDFVLLELADSPLLEHEVSYAGWDIRDSSSSTTGVVAIHHPSGDEKRISFENDRTGTSGYGSNSLDPDQSHIRVEDWDLGTTEPGSSGSALFNLEHRVIGQLHGGGAACGNNLPDWYGRLSRSFEDTNIVQHLDPLGQGVEFVDTLTHDGVPPPPPAPFCGDNAINGDEFCDGTDVPQVTTCFDEGFVPGVGDIGCQSDCSAIDTSRCDYAGDVLSGSSGNIIIQDVVNLDYAVTQLRFEMFGGSGDADLYVRFGAAPTTSIFDCRPYTPGNVEDCFFDNPSQGEYYFMVRAYSTFSGVSLRVTADLEEPVLSQCGNGVIDSGELCDGDAMTASSCYQADNSFLDGVGELGCMGDCSGYDTTNCVLAPVCGDGVIEAPEICDGGTMPLSTCFQFNNAFLDGVGQLACLSDCSGYDTTDCQLAPVCGDGVIEGSEECDGTPTGITCSEVDSSFLAGQGSLDCLLDCSDYDTSNCEMAFCGDDVVEGTEFCDGITMPAASCFEADNNFLDGVGQLACLSDCSGYDTSDCQVDATPVCGDGAIEGSEVCDGDTIPGGITCNSVDSGFLVGEGELHCLSDCSGFNTTRCRAVVHEKLNKNRNTNRAVGGSTTLSADASYIRFQAFGATSGDPDLYVSIGSRLTWNADNEEFENYDCRPYYGSTTTEVCASDREGGEKISLAPGTKYFYKVHAYEEAYKDMSVQIIADGIQV